MTEGSPAVPAPFDMKAIDAAVDRMTPAQRAAARVEAESVALGLDAMQLANEYAKSGDLGGAARWYAVAARHGAEGAGELLSEVKVLIRVTAGGGIADDAQRVEGSADPMMLALQAMAPEQRAQRLGQLRAELWRRLEQEA